jgi:hypothetical protein
MESFLQSKAQLVLLFAAGFAFPCAAQTGTVTFYSYASTAKQQVEAVVVPAGVTLTFPGWLYDGNKKMAHSSRGRFMTFHVPAGEHEFGISFHSKKPGKTSLHLIVEGGKRYCVRLSMKNLSPLIVPVGVFDLKIEEVSCMLAGQEAGTYKRIDIKRVEPAARADLDTSSSFPQWN